MLSGAVVATDRSCESGYAIQTCDASLLLHEGGAALMLDTAHDATVVALLSSSQPRQHLARYSGMSAPSRRPFVRARKTPR